MKESGWRGAFQLASFCHGPVHAVPNLIYDKETLPVFQLDGVCLCEPAYVDDSCDPCSLTGGKVEFRFRAPPQFAPTVPLNHLPHENAAKKHFSALVCLLVYTYVPIDLL